MSPKSGSAGRAADITTHHTAGPACSGGALLTPISDSNATRREHENLQKPTAQLHTQRDTQTAEGPGRQCRWSAVNLTHGDGGPRDMSGHPSPLFSQHPAATQLSRGEVN